MKKLLLTLCLLWISAGCTGRPSTLVPVTIPIEPSVMAPNIRPSFSSASAVVTVEATIPPATIAAIQPMKFLLEGQGTEALSADASRGMTLKVKGINAIDQKMAFLFGSFEGQGNSDIRSVLFRTEDGGETWIEVMKPLTISEVNHIAFVQDGIGWASVSWTAEGILGTRLWHTTDYGKSWREIPNFNSGRMGVWGMRFLDAQNGQIVFLDDTGNPVTDGVVLWITSDGGNHWKEDFRYHLPPGLTPRDKYLEAYAGAEGGRYGSHWGNCEYPSSHPCQAFGGDGSEWIIQSDINTKYYLIRSVLPTAAKESAHRLPLDFRYQNGAYIGQ